MSDWDKEGWTLDHVEGSADEMAHVMDRVMPDDVDFAFCWRKAGHGMVFRSRGDKSEMASQLKLLLAKLEIDEENKQ